MAVLQSRFVLRCGEHDQPSRKFVLISVHVTHYLCFYLGQVQLRLTETSFVLQVLGHEPEHWTNENVDLMLGAGGKAGSEVELPARRSFKT